MSRTAVTYHIIGGGIAGLSAAKFIKDKNPENHVILYEAAHKLGGRCFSFYDAKLDRTIDNATHVILGANKNVRALTGELEFDGRARFWNGQYCDNQAQKFAGHILLSIFNTQPEDIGKKLTRKLFWKLFPFMPAQLKVYFSKGNLSAKLVEPLSRYADEIRLGHVLQQAEISKKYIQTLIFNKGKVAVGPKDKIICALDAAAYKRVFGGEEFEFNEICNVFFRTSTSLSLPDEASFAATPDNIGDWIFINDDVVGVTISDSGGITESDDELARLLWKEIRAIRGLKPAFLPPYRVMRYPQATIRQDDVNNQKRPNSAASPYKNMALAGDWTMKNWPCCLEAAVVSAKRAVDLCIKYKHI